MYIEMLGHSASFCHIEAVNLTQNKNLVLKRLGYLLCSLFLNSKSDLTIMLISTIQKDLSSTNIHEIVICLTSIDRIMNSTIAGAIQDLVIKLLDHTTDLIRKKAILILQRIVIISSFRKKSREDKLESIKRKWRKHSATESHPLWLHPSPSTWKKWERIPKNIGI